MNLSKIFSLGLVALALGNFCAPKMWAHNNARYAGVPFVMPASCTGATASWVNQNGSLVLQLTSGFDEDAGFQIFNSIPGSNSNSASTSSGFIPAGTYSFILSGMPPGAAVYAYTIQGPASLLVPIDGTVTTNGTVSYPVPASTYMTEVYIYGAAFTNVRLSNFRQNNQPILADTTQVATSSAMNYFNFCY